MDHSGRINTAVWAEGIFHSCATCFSIFCPLLWIIKCVCESKHQAITLPLSAWGITLQGILVIHIFWAMCSAVLYWIKWVQIETRIVFTFLINHKNSIVRWECFSQMGHPWFGCFYILFYYAPTNYCMLSIIPRVLHESRWDVMRVN